MTSEPLGQLIGASCVHAEAAGSTIATFVFSVVDTDAVRRLIEHMYIEFDVCEGADGELAYSLAVPDRALGPWLLTISPDDLGLIEETQRLLNTIPSFIRGERGAPIGLADFAMDLDHDFSGRYVKAGKALKDGRADEARSALLSLIDEQPTGLHHARRLLGRCHLAAGDTSAAIEALIGGVRIARLTAGERLHPAASTSLCDLAEIYSKQGRPGAAALCLLHALELRPNNPDALLALGSIFPNEGELVEHILARVFAVGGRDDDAVAWAEKNGAAPSIARARQLAGDVLLSTWPYGGPDFASPEHIELALSAPEAPPKPPKPTSPLYNKSGALSGPSKIVVAGEGGKGGAAGGVSKPLLIGLAVGALLLALIAYLIYSSMSLANTGG